MKPHLQVLENFGLKRIGEWVFGHYESTHHLKGLKGIQYKIPSQKSLCGFVYAFSIDNEVVYVGETTQIMGERLNGYRYGNPVEQDTDNRVKVYITKTLENKKKVLIWAGSKTADIKLPGETLHLPINKPIEEELIRRLSPALNNKRV